MIVGCRKPGWICCNKTSESELDVVAPPVILFHSACHAKFSRCVVVCRYYRVRYCYERAPLSVPACWRPYLGAKEPLAWPPGNRWLHNGFASFPSFSWKKATSTFLSWVLSVHVDLSHCVYHELSTMFYLSGFTWVIDLTHAIFIYSSVSHLHTKVEVRCFIN